MRTQDAKRIHLNDFLRAIGAKKSREQLGTNGHEWVWHCPGRNDATPSLCVNVEKNIWSDVPMDAGGRIIELVNHVYGRDLGDVRSALRDLDSIFPYMKGHSKLPTTSACFSSVSARTNSDGVSVGATGLKNKSGGLKLVSARPLFRYPLKDYVQSRGIPLEIANAYLMDIEYEITASKSCVFAVGFRAGDTYALRSKFFKGFLSSGVDITTFDRGTPEVAVFEGFMDFLSWLSAKDCITPPQSAIVLNSTALVQRAITWIQSKTEIETVRVFRDRDELSGGGAGLRMFERLSSSLPAHEVIDLSKTYPMHNDLNAWWMERERPREPSFLSQ